MVAPSSTLTSFTNNFNESLQRESGHFAIMIKKGNQAQISSKTIKSCLIMVLLGQLLYETI